MKLLLWLAVPMLALAATPDFRLERTAVPGGAELLTVFASVPDQAEQVPLISVLRDTLGDRDPSNDRLRYIWTLTATSPTLLQRAAAAIPFFYFRPNLGKNADETPHAVIDLGDTSTSVWNSLAQQIMQLTAMDSNGALIRASTRRYRTNVSDRRRVHMMEGLAVVSQLEEVPEIRESLSETELLEIQARMTLAGQTLGGLVTANKLTDAYFTQRTRAQEIRGHNWELLRQRAEANGLYFDPLGIGSSPTHAMLWIAREDAFDTNHPFHSRFLGITNPFTDNRVLTWTGITVTRDGHELIPLALYGLDYPKVPLLLIDFRNTYAPKRREMLARATTDVVTGLIGYSKWGNWPYMAGSFLWNFTSTRRGSATNGQQRLKAYSEVRRWLTLDHALTPELRRDLLERLEILGVNPLDQSVFQEMQIAQRQYAALLKYAADPKGLAVKLDRDRSGELTTYQHTRAARTGFVLARFATLGIYKHHESQKNGSLLTALDQYRRTARPVEPAPVLALAQPNAAGN
jgi:hypothetical protein